MASQTYELTGAVTEIVTKTNDKIIFSLKTTNGIGYRVECPFFCPVAIGDGCFLVVQVQDSVKKYVRVVKPPFVTLPMDKDNCIQFFIRTLKGVNFGAVSSSKLYDELSKYAKELKYGEDFINHKDSTKIFSYYAISNEDRYSGDGVISLLTEISADYNSSKNEQIIDLLVGKNGESAGNVVSKLKATMTRAQARKLLDEWHNKRSMRRLYLLGLTRTEIVNSNINLDDLYNICMDNPYKVPSIIYEKCEKILNIIGKVPLDEQRFLGRINRFIYDNANSKGWSCTPNFIMKKTYPLVESYLKMKPEFLKEYGLVLYKDKFYTTHTFKVEKFVSEYINKSIEETCEIYESDKFNTDNLIGNFYELKTLTDEQKLAIDGALKCRISIITSGGGCGKSTIIREISRNLTIRGVSHVVSSFTGKAVSRLHEIMKNKNAITIDRYIMKVKERKGNDPKFDVKNVKHIIIDESSMVTTELFYRLLQQLDSRVNFTFVGDTQQIQPIGWGSIMKELIASGRIPTFYLTKNQRIQSSVKETSESLTDISSKVNGEKLFDRAILENANNLVNPKRNLSTPLKFVQGSGFYILNGAKETVTNIVKALHSKEYKLSDFVIISPYKQPLDDLNSIVQDIYLPAESTFRYVQPTANGGRTWAVGDKVMMIANNYKINIFNGDIGKVVGLDDNGVKVKFEDEAEHLFKFTKEGVADEDNISDVDEKSSSDELFVNYLAHSFAMTSHKSQGSEYNFVILYLESKGFGGSFLNINLLYTSITRAKQTVWVVCDEPMLNRITMTKSSVRYDGLSSMLCELKNVEKEEILKPLTLNPEFLTNINSSVSITQLHDDFDEVDLYDLYADDF